VQFAVLAVDDERSAPLAVQAGCGSTTGYAGSESERHRRLPIAALAREHRQRTILDEVLDSPRDIDLGTFQQLGHIASP
jgi:hypothetical protein